jgi:hypothetical protein
VTEVGLYASGLGLNGRVVVLSMDANPVSTPVFPTWLEIQTNAGLPLNTPVPPRTCVRRLPPTSQLNPRRGDQRGVASGSFPVEYCAGCPAALRNVSASAFAFA